jgi:hypothetical protein
VSRFAAADDKWPCNRKGTLSISFQALLEVTYWYRWCMVWSIVEHNRSPFDLLRFIYDFVAFPNGIFSGTIISSVVHNGDIKKIAEWQLLLSSIITARSFHWRVSVQPFGTSEHGRHFVE